MPWNTPPAFASGPASSSSLNDLVDDTNYLKDALDLHGITSDTTLQPLKGRLYGCRLTNTTDISAGDGVDKVLTWDTETFDSTPALHSTGSNTARITIPSGGDGFYDIKLCVRFASNATGDRQLWIELNGSILTGTIIAKIAARAATGTQTQLFVSAFYELGAGDFVTANFNQTSGGSLAAGLSAGSGQYFSAHRIFAS